MKIQPPGTVVAVEWRDAESRDDWADVTDRLKEHEELPTIITVGIVLRHNDEGIVVARSYQEKDSILEGSFHIGSGMIKSVKKLNYKPISIITD